MPRFWIKGKGRKDNFFASIFFFFFLKMSSSLLSFPNLFHFRLVQLQRKVGNYISMTWEKAPLFLNTDEQFFFLKATFFSYSKGLFLCVVVVPLEIIPSLIFPQLCSISFFFLGWVVVLSPNKSYLRLSIVVAAFLRRKTSSLQIYNLLCCFGIFFFVKLRKIYSSSF